LFLRNKERGARQSVYVSCGLFIWLVTSEAGTELWYRVHESQMALPVITWSAEFPKRNATFVERPFSEKTKRLLRFNEGRRGSWETAEGLRCEAVFLQWNPGRAAASLGRVHRPENCLTAAGLDLVRAGGLRWVSVADLRLPFQFYVFTRNGFPFCVFYCLWEDRSNGEEFQIGNSRFAQRLQPVLLGRRNTGQRSLEIAFWGVADEAAAEATLKGELRTLLHSTEGGVQYISDNIEVGNQK